MPNFSSDQSDFRAEYHRIERSWYLWNGRDAIQDEHGAIRLFNTAQDAYDWQATANAASDGDDRRCVGCVRGVPHVCGDYVAFDEICLEDGCPEQAVHKGRCLHHALAANKAAFDEDGRDG